MLCPYETMQKTADTYPGPVQEHFGSARYNRPAKCG